MAENIFKVYPDGIWYNDTDEERYDHICKKLDAFVSKEDDYNDLNWHLKNAVIGKIYISQNVKDLGDEAWIIKPSSSDRLHEILTEIDTNGCADWHYIDLKKWLNGRAVRFEHVIPCKVYIQKMIELFKAKQFTLNEFKKLREKLNICIVTLDEDQSLDRQFRYSMPKGWDWDTGDPWARYNSVASPIIIYKQNNP